MSPPLGFLQNENLDIETERVRTAIQQIPTAAAVTIVNALVMAAVLRSTSGPSGTYVWLATATVVAAARLGLWRVARARRISDRLARWSLASTLGAFAAGLVWGGGFFVLVPESEITQLLWVFVTAGMCGGAAAVHYAHWPTALGFILPATLPLAVGLAFAGTTTSIAAAAMTVVFIAALSSITLRSSTKFGRMLRLQFQLGERTRELDLANARLKAEIAEHRETERILSQSQKMEALGQLTGGIAHDFSNVLTVVLGNLEILKRRDPKNDPIASRVLDTAIQGAERGAGLIHRLLAFSRRQQLDAQTVDLGTIVVGLLPILRTTLGDEVIIDLDFPQNLPRVTVDTNQLELALLNLIVNARDAMPNGGLIQISGRESFANPQAGSGELRPKFVVLCVRDTGEGMDETVLEHAIEPFFTTKSAGKGTGLGLSMVHGFAVQSGGRFLLTSQPGKGTEAALWLPSAPNKERSASPAQKALKISE